MSNKFILQNLDNYNKYITDNYSTILYKYIDIINNYIILSFDYSYLYSNNNIIKKGIETLHHIFNVIFLYTLNLDLTCYHCDKAMYYYIEFISQMSGDNNILQLTCKDVTLFVFKKTIFDLSNDSKIRHSLNKEDKLTIDIVKKVSLIYNTLIYSSIDDGSMMNGLEYYKALLSTSYKSMNYILSEKIDNYRKNDKSNDKEYKVATLNVENYLMKLNVIEIILQALNDKKCDNKNQIIELFIKKIFNMNSLNTDIKSIKYKLYDDLFDEYLNGNANRFITWILHE